MSGYDFTTILDRTGKDAIAAEVIPVPGAEVEEGCSRIPMWVADMNFAVAPSITKALSRRLENPTYGYFVPSDAYYDGIIRWQKKRNGAEGLTREMIGYENGVLGCLASALQAFTCPGDCVLLHSPTYIGFTGIIERDGRKIVLSPLKRDAQGVWRMDYEDMDRRIRENHIRFAVLCSPHNPCGRVWTRQELEDAYEVYRRNDCIVVSDEIWSDLTLEGYRHIPSCCVNEDARKRTIAVYAPSKTFNLAGLIGSYHIIYDAYLRDRVRAQAEMSHYNNMNVLSMHALIGAYSEEGEEWVDELRKVLTENADYACGYIRDHFPGVEVFRPEGTYMLFLDCEEWCRMHGTDGVPVSMDELLRRGIRRGVIWQDGRPFHGAWSIRMNLALPTSRVKEAFDRLRWVFETPEN